MNAPQLDFAFRLEVTSVRLAKVVPVGPVIGGLSRLLTARLAAQGRQGVFSILVPIGETIFADRTAEVDFRYALGVQSRHLVDRI